ncbi:hypothetical protein LTR84_005545 [Exophiala bonariae]|uniref:DNA replication regulator SLD2 n=1 Tax=Exophiala bonariae TaxID=1690606 RepID=A0AAV9N8F6_9EURO|nr:hypothetical protein LTR84_005545 [Exophiala bonariae]
MITIDFNKLGAATGSTPGAARMKYMRLREKILPISPDLATSGSIKRSFATAKTQRPFVLGAVPQKRKAPEVLNDNGEDANDDSGSSSSDAANLSNATKAQASVTPAVNSGKRQAPSGNNDSRNDEKITKKINSVASAQSSLANKRKTRGKKLNYDISALCGSANDDGRSEITQVIDDSSDDDFDVGAAETRSGTRSDLNMPTAKRAKKETSGQIRGTITKSASYSRKKSTAAPKKRSTARPRIPAKQRQNNSGFRKPAIPKTKSSILRPCDRPFPSIEASSPPLSEAPTDSDSDSDSEGDSDIDIKSLKPGTILSFGKDGGNSMPSSNNKDGITQTPNKSAARPATNTTRSALTIYGASDSTSESSASSKSSISPGPELQLQTKLNAHDVLPSDSVSMINESKPAFNPVTPPPQPTNTSTETRSGKSIDVIVLDD